MRFAAAQTPVLSEPYRAAIIAAVRQAARDHILPRFRSLGADEVSTKSGPGDLVTLADTEAEAAIIAALRQDWPEAEVMGEESVAANPALRERMGQAEWAVIIDPVDGTWNFAKGLGVYGVILAVVSRGRVVWGMLYDPMTDDWIEADAATPTRMIRANGAQARLETSLQRKTSRMVGYVSLGLFPKALQPRIAVDMTAFSRASTLRCACHEYRMVAQGHVDFCLSGPIPHPWDHAAGVLCVQQAGGVARFLDGEDYHTARLKGVVLAASSEEVWQEQAARFAYLA